MALPYWVGLLIVYHLNRLRDKKNQPSMGLQFFLRTIHVIDLSRSSFFISRLRLYLLWLPLIIPSLKLQVPVLSDAS